jgi:hypothetical protein
VTISRLVYDVRVPGVEGPVSPTSGTIAMDESWSPFLTGTMTFPLRDGSLVAALDPRTGERVQFRVSRQYGDGVKMSDLTGDGLTGMADMTADLAGGPLSTWTDRYATPYNASGSQATRYHALDLGVRSRSVDYVAGTVSVTVASDEALLQDMVNVFYGDEVPATATVYGVVALALASIGATLGPDPAPDVPLDPDGVGWQPGQSAWDYVAPLVDAAGLRLYCDAGRVWRLVVPNTLTPGELDFDPTNVTRLDDSVSRDTQWYDAVMITYRWRNASGVDRTQYASAASPDFTKVLAIQEDRPYPGLGAARALLARASGRGRIATVEAVIDPDARPGQAITIMSPTGPVQTGIATQVQWNVDTDRMQIRTRDLIEVAETLTPEDAALAAGVPLGVSALL